MIEYYAQKVIFNLELLSFIKEDERGFLYKDFPDDTDDFIE